MRWIRAARVSSAEPAGSVTRVVGVAEDITEAQTSARRNPGGRDGASVERGTLAIGVREVCNRHRPREAGGRIVEANRAFQELVGYTHQELKTLSYVDITHEADIPRGAEVSQQLLSAQAREVQLEKRYRHKDGTIHLGRGDRTVIPGSDGSPQYLLGSGRGRDRSQGRQQELDASVSSCARSRAD
jgi:PAS domain S-box-containing protein